MLGHDTQGLLPPGQRAERPWGQKLAVAWRPEARLCCKVPCVRIRSQAVEFGVPVIPHYAFGETALYSVSEVRSTPQPAHVHPDSPFCQ